MLLQLCLLHHDFIHHDLASFSSVTGEEQSRILLPREDEHGCSTEQVNRPTHAK